MGRHIAGALRKVIKGKPESKWKECSNPVVFSWMLDLVSAEKVEECRELGWIFYLTDADRMRVDYQEWRSKIWGMTTVTRDGILMYGDVGRID